ncbi:MAG TPA: polysaccharide biosynthesis tyrosine autokinase [Verrucomicrobiae bacterium]|nr:polysaccharide biosynthesis tyrosine autokinase [Verrucomicrobiae bacterium]
MIKDKNSPVSSPASPIAAHMADRLNLMIYARRYVQLVLRRWPVLVLCTLAGLGYNTYKAVTSPDIFQAYSTVTVNSIVQTSHDDRAKVVEATDNNYWNDQLVKMEAQPVRERVAERMKDRPRPASLELSASKQQGAFFKLNVRSTDFDFAQRYAIAWAEEFVKWSDDERNNALEKRSRGNREQMIEIQRKLDEVRTNIQEFQKKYTIIDIKQQCADAEQRLASLNNEYHAKKTEFERLKKMTREEIAHGAWRGVSPPATSSEKGTKPDQATATERPEVPDPLTKYATDSKYSALNYQLQTNQIYRTNLLQTLKPRHPAVVAVDAAIRQLNFDIDFELKNIDAQKLARLSLLESEAASYGPLIEEATQKFKKLAEIKAQFSQLDEDQTTYQNQILSMRNQLSQLELTRGGNEEQWKVSERGVGSDSPVEPNRQRIILRGFVTGLAIGLVIIFLLHRLDDRLDLAEDIERELEEPVLGQVPQMDVKAIKAQRLLVTNLPQNDMFAESIRGVRSTVLMTVGAGSKRVFIVTSAVPGDGKTTFTVNFAATLAITGARVLLVDADLRRGSTHLYFNHQRDSGLSDILSGATHWSDVVKTTDQKTLGLITSGQLPANPGELLLGPIVEQFIKEAREEYDYIIIDTPPLTSINDTFALVGFSDGLVFVVRAGQTSMRFAKNALAAVRQRDARVLGLVLNGITSDNPYYYYHYYYHAYYNQEQKQSIGTPAESRPAREMAPRRRSSMPSIEAEAKTQVGEKVSSSRLAIEERNKIEQYKSRRAALKPSLPVETNPVVAPPSDTPPGADDDAGNQG